MVRVKFEAGSVFRVPVDGDTFAYARMLKTDPFMAFYEAQGGTREGGEALGQSVNSTPLFMVATEYKQAIIDGRWLKIGKVPLDDAKDSIPLQFVQSIGNPGRLRVIDAMGNMRESSFDECKDLERFAVWDWSHVEERLADHYSGREDKYLRRQQIERL